MESGVKNAIGTLAYTARNVVAYQKVLAEAGLDFRRVRDRQSFSALPVIDKAAYIRKFATIEQIPNGVVPSMMYASSGSSGRPTYWFSEDAYEHKGAQFHDYLFKRVLHISPKERVLVVVCFSMGVWVAGHYTLASCKGLTRMGYKITTITPGLDRGDIHTTLINFADQFDIVLVCGYPPFLMDILLDLKKQKWQIPKHFKFLTAGDMVSESWRDALAAITGHSVDTLPHVNIYGCADAGPLGFETPLTVALKKLYAQHKEVRSIFVGTEMLMGEPALFQYLPEQIYFEQVGTELAITANATIPLVRYNLHDVGTVMDALELKKRLQMAGIDLPAALWQEWPLPVIIKTGRTDVAMMTYALNIYPENIRAGLTKRVLKRKITGNFFAYAKFNPTSRREEFHVELELRPQQKPEPGLAVMAKEFIFNALVKYNIEYRKLFNALGERVKPRVQLKQVLSIHFAKKQSAGLLQTTGKKPRVVIKG